MSENYVYCFVPKCVNSSHTAPDKLFFNVPSGAKRLQWCEAVGIQKRLSEKSSLRCCEDHFNLAEDVKNLEEYRRQKEAGARPRLKLKPNVIPRIFSSQSDQVLPSNHDFTSETSGEPALWSSLFHDYTRLSEPEPMEESSCSAQDGEKIEFRGGQMCGYKTVQMPAKPICTKTAGIRFVSQMQPDEYTGEKIQKLICRYQSSNFCETNDPGHEILKSPNQSVIHLPEALPNHSEMNNVNSGIQKLPTQSPFKLPESCGRSCCKKVPEISVVKVSSFSTIQEKVEDSPEFVTLSQCTTITSSSEPPLEDNNTDESPKDYEFNFENEQRRILNMKVMKRNPRRYLGILPETLGIIPLLEKYTKLEEIKIYVALRKVRKNESLDDLVDIFGLSRSTISRYLKEAIPAIAGYIKKFIFWPDRDIIQANLPLQFRAYYSKVESIIDCFEIEIEKPSNPVHQSLTWSSYKNCNTIKFLVSITPDGHINYVSECFNGRASDPAIVEHSGYLDLLKPNTHSMVLADRGFKNIEELLLEKSCELKRPKSVQKSTPMTKDDVRSSKIISSLRVHVERVIKRLREYEILEPHACIHHDLLCMADCFVGIACGLANLQYPIIKCV